MARRRERGVTMGSPRVASNRERYAGDPPEVQSVDRVLPPVLRDPLLPVLLDRRAADDPRGEEHLVRGLEHALEM